MGTVPYQFTREALLAKKTQEIKQDLEHYNLHKHYFTAAVNSEWFIMPFTKEEYFKVCNAPHTFNPHYFVLTFSHNLGIRG